MDNYFKKLNDINCNEHTEQKNGLTYLSWAWAWQMVKLNFPDSTYKIYKNEQGWNYHTDGRTAWVETGVTINGIEHIEMLPVMDYKNKSIPLENITSFDVNKAIQRSLTKSAGRHGLGLYIYAGSDLPESEKDSKGDELETCENCGNLVKPATSKKGQFIPRKQVVEIAKEKYGKILCADCMEKLKNESKD